MKTALIIAPHPDDAELAMGGTIARMIGAGFEVIVADLTDGEPTPLGSKEIRAKETKIASGILGVSRRICLGMENRNLQATLENRRKVAKVIRLCEPDVLFGPAMPDWHPDHRVAHQLAEDARFEAKYHKTEMRGRPCWVANLYFYYSPHRSEYLKPSFIIDISDCWSTKLAAMKAYESQMKNISNGSAVRLDEKIEIANKYFGQCINVGYGEPFISSEPITIKDFNWLICGGE